jgi:hypothetical protein
MEEENGQAQPQLYGTQYFSVRITLTGQREPILLDEGMGMPRVRWKLRERTHDWQQVQQYTLWPEQKAYKPLRPVVLFGKTADERTKEAFLS